MSAKTERLVNLTVALLATSRPLTFQQLRQRMGEWQDGDPESQRRKFERDKEELRRLGVPIESVMTDALGGEQAYRIDPARYALPDVPLTVEQMTVLAVAFQLVEGGADQLTFSKVAARAPDPHHAEVPSGIAVRAADVSHVAPLASAIVDGRVVRFTHRRTTGERIVREVEPYALLQRRGTWYLRGLDRTVGEHRVFRTDRIEGAVEVTDEPVTFAQDEIDPHAADAMFALPDEVDVTVAVRSSDGWQVEERRDRWWRATSRALGASPDVVMLAPPDAREAVIHGLRSLLAVHGEEVDA